LILFNSSPAVNEALVSGAIDIGFASDFAAITVMASGAPVVAIGHQSAFRGAIMSTNDEIDALDKLGGEQVYGLFGVTVYQSAIEMVQKAGLEVGSDVSFVNIGFSELADAVRAAHVDAFFTWDPWIAFFEKQGVAKTLGQDIAPTMVIMARRDFVEENPDVVQRFLRAHAEALFWAGQNDETTNEWFRIPEAARQIDVDVIATASEFDPNWTAESFDNIRIGFTPEQVERLRGLAQFTVDNDLAPRLAPIDTSVLTDIGDAVEAAKADTPFDASAVQVLKP
jgi:sulfonate transport system substrate-binding protein